MPSSRARPGFVGLMTWCCDSARGTVWFGGLILVPYPYPLAASRSVLTRHSFAGFVSMAHFMFPMPVSRMISRRRTGNHAQYFTRRGLLLQRLLEFFEKPHILDGDHGLISESLDQLDLRRCEGTRLGSTCGQRSNKFSLLSKGNGQKRACVARGTQYWEFRLRPSVGKVECALFAHPANPGLINIELVDANGYGYRTKMSPQKHRVSFAESQHCIIDPTNPRGALNDGVEDRLHIGGRAADNAEHLSRRGLMLQGFAQFRVAFLDLLEKANILDGDHRLVGERSDQFDLFIGKGENFLSLDQDHSKKSVLP